MNLLETPILDVLQAIGLVPSSGKDMDDIWPPMEYVRLWSVNFSLRTITKAARIPCIYKNRLAIAYFAMAATQTLSQASNS